MKRRSFPLEEWAVPGKKFRSAPFWSWNGKLEESELRRQIRVFKTMGMGGFFMHSRIGLATPYLSDEWFKLIHACIDEAKKQDMDAWLYDEDRWPSGYAGGQVTRTPKYRMKLIYLTEVPFEQCGSCRIQKNTVALFAAEVNGCCASNIRKIEFPGDVRATETMLLFTLKTAAPDSWFNGGSYLNPMNPSAVRKFLKLTHEAYLKKCGGEFGKVIPGIFTDEPQYGFVTTRQDWVGDIAYSTPFDPQIRERIMARYQYDIFEHLPELFFDVKEMDFHLARLHYIGIMTELFLENYARPIGEWCRQHNLCYTGHVMGEDSLAWQTWNCGSPMRFFRYMGMPGIDVLSERESNYFIARLLSSAGRQFGKKNRLAELYGCTGWDFPPAGHKAIGDWLMAHGVNFRCQHLAHYTLAGEAKRDYPASICAHLPWYRDYSLIENYFARINTALHRGRELCDILLLLPVESAWCLIRKDFLTAPDLMELDRQYAKLNQKLTRRVLEFDLGDEEILAADGHVELGQLKIGQAAYRAVVVPAMLTIRESTLLLLTQFKASGGTIVFAADPPGRVDGIPDRRPADLAEWCQNSGLDALERFRRIQLDVGQGEILCHLRSEPSIEWLFVVNAGCVPGGEKEQARWEVPPVTKREAEFPALDIRWNTRKKGKIFECDPENGNLYLAHAEKSSRCWTLHTSLPRLGSRLFALTDEDWPVVPRNQGPPRHTEFVEFPSEFTYETDQPNVLILDHFRYRLEGGNWSRSEKYVLTLDDEIRRSLNIPVRSPNMIQPWAGSVSCGNTANLELKAEFQCNSLPEGKLFLALENPESFQISMNGIPIAVQSCGWMTDHAIQMLELPSRTLLIGKNRLRLVLRYDCTYPGLEAVFLCGNFGVRSEGVSGCLIRRPESLRYGSWTLQGFPFYPGAITYCARVKRHSSRPFWLKLPAFSGALCRVKCNGYLLRVWMWPPYELDLSPFVSKNKTAFLELEIVGSPRNMLGPFFTQEQDPHFCIPDHFKDNSGKRRKLVDYGFHSR